MADTFASSHEFTAKYDAKTAHLSSISTFTKGSHPIPGDGYNPESQFKDTWVDGIPAGWGGAKGAARKAPAKKAKGGSKRAGAKPSGRIE